MNDLLTLGLVAILAFALFFNSDPDNTR
ncbi:hypothetical protein CcrC2_gp462 [Caulobacter phage C2]|nr:hypothetical protein CcrC2_gp462 [Caulobacter phage C2]